MQSRLHRSYGWGLTGADLATHLARPPARRGPASALTRDLRALQPADLIYPEPGGGARDLLAGEPGQKPGRPENLVSVVGTARIPEAVIFYPDIAHRRYWHRDWPGTSVRTVIEPPTLMWLDAPAPPDALRWYLEKHGFLDAAGIAKLRPVRAQWEQS